MQTENSQICRDFRPGTPEWETPNERGKTLWGKRREFA
ncbi:hypothetical protein PLANPX_2284 [Lacipirellula parvula]|uniref:Uncharacterized protein n=1 Tax=Lacipirellula parvula TaxID=2650471 RepID=A0A5K7X9Y4_9BACT|nr:hypothetical protein PLANPX_2284 [Lacipirellula parvula]